MIANMIIVVMLAVIYLIAPTNNERKENKGIIKTAFQALPSLSKVYLR
jgi:hypothetical protein